MSSFASSSVNQDLHLISSRCGDTSPMSSVQQHSRMSGTEGEGELKDRV